METEDRGLETRFPIVYSIFQAETLWDIFLTNGTTDKKTKKKSSFTLDLCNSSEQCICSTEVSTEVLIQDKPHAENSVDVATDSLDVGCHEVSFCGLLAHVLNHRCHGSQDPFLLL